MIPVLNISYLCFQSELIFCLCSFTLLHFSSTVFPQLSLNWTQTLVLHPAQSLGCGPSPCQALSVRACCCCCCCCSGGFHPLHNPGRPLPRSPQAHQRLIFHASGPVGEARSQGQVGGRGGPRRPVSQHLSPGRGARAPASN